MSLTIGITNPRGIVLSADSRQTYINNLNQNRIGSDTATKILPLTRSVAVTFAGSVYLEAPSPENPYPKSVDEYIGEFAYGLKGGESVSKIAHDLHKFLTDIYNIDEKVALAKQQLIAQIKLQKGTIINNSLSVQPDGRAVTAQVRTADGQEGIAGIGLNSVSITVAGYDKLGTKNPQQHLFLLDIPGQVAHQREQGKEGQYGAAWQGQTDVVNRIIKGFDPLRIGNLPFFQITDPKRQAEVSNQLSGLEYVVNWQSISLHDAIEISKLLIETSIAMQKFSNGPMMDPTDIQGIGGAVDIAIIDPINGFGWYRSKEITVTRPEFRDPLDKKIDNNSKS